MEHPIRLFLIAVFKRWWELLSCAVFTILGVYTAATNRGNAWIVAGTGLLAAGLFAVAAYRAWLEEHEKYIGEAAKNELPDIKGEAFNFIYEPVHIDGYEGGDVASVLGGAEGKEYEGHKSASCGVIFKAFLCNHRPMNTTLRAIELDGSRLTPPVIFEIEPPVSSRLYAAFHYAKLRGVSVPDRTPFVGTDLPYGLGKTITVQSTARIDGLHFGEMLPIPLDELRLHVVDAFDRKHLIQIRPGERLFW